VTAVDVAPARRTIAERLGVGFAMPAEAPPDADVVFHASASAAGLATAIASAGDEARIVELSWYGDGEVPVALGGPFHSRRLQLVSSQVGQVSPAHRPRWSRARRLAKALDLLADDALEALITEEIRFADLPAAMPRLLAPGAPGLATVVRYD
jgi:threonine dehydrogenase-like Zn-dependent dehydrogenase